MAADKVCSHLRRISCSEAHLLIRSVNRRLADSLLEVDSRSSRRHTESAPSLYFAEYEYGRLLMGPRPVSEDVVGGFLPPCRELTKACASCKRVFKQLQGERPLYVVLNRTVEEFLEDFEPYGTRQKPRLVSTRLLTAGEILGLSEGLNALIDPEYSRRPFRAPIRKASAGIRSVFIAAPVGNKQLKDSLKAMKLRSQNAPTDAAVWNSDWDDWQFLKAASEVALEASKASWMVQVIIIPIAWLRSNVYSRGAVKRGAREFLLQLFEMAWKESRGLRSESIRQLTLSQTARGIQGNTNADLIVQRLLLILRGDAPGFRPATLSDERFSMTAIWQLLLGNERLQKKFFPVKLPDIKFPGFIEPFFLDRRAAVAPGTFFYYPLTSFEQLGYPGRPEDEIETMEQLDALLKRIKRENPGLLGSVSWRFFASPEPLKDRSGSEIPRVTTVDFESAHLSEIIQADFSEQLRSAAKFMSAPPAALLSKRPRKGFLRRFIRMSFD